MNVITKFEQLNFSEISSKEYPNIKSNLQKITTKLTKIINAIANAKGATFTPDQKRGLISAFVKSISTNYIVLPIKAKNKIEGNTGESTKKLIKKIKSKIKEYINICTKLNEKGKLGLINNSADFINTIEENINIDILKIRLKEFLGVKKEDKMEKLIELITSNSNKNNSKGKSLIFSIVANMAGINEPTNNSNTLYYEIISNLFISDICDLIDLCTVTKNKNSGTIVNVEYTPDEITSEGDSKTILDKDNQEKLNKIIIKVVDYRTRATVS